MLVRMDVAQRAESHGQQGPKNHRKLFRDFSMPFNSIGVSTPSGASIMNLLLTQFSDAPKF